MYIFLCITEGNTKKDTTVIIQQLKIIVISKNNIVK